MNKRLKIFEFYSRDFINTINRNRLGFYSEEQDNKIDFTGAYVCPLTLKAYFKADIDQLTIEHVPESSLGGNPIILTDRDINSKHGHSIDKKMLTFFEYRNYKRGEQLLKGKMRIPSLINGSIPVIAEINKERVIRIGIKSDNMDLVLDRGLLKNWDGLSINLTIKYNPYINKNALLKAAYLIAFSKIGYKLLFDQNGFKQLTYGQIISEICKDSWSDNFPLVFLEKADIDIPNAIGVAECKNRKFLVVQVLYELKDIRYNYLVFLPNPDDKDLYGLGEFKQNIEKEKVDITFKQINQDYLLKIKRQ